MAKEIKDNQNKATIEDVLACYDKHGFDTNQDVPGNFLWEDLYRAVITFLYESSYNEEKQNNLNVGQVHLGRK